MKATLSKLPKTLDEMKAMPESSLLEPQNTIALALAALDRYPEDKQAAFDMLAYLRGPRGELNETEKQFLRDRFADNTDYVPRSFFAGATPENDYTPNVPYVLEVTENSYSHDDPPFARYWIQSGGADSPRPVMVREKPSEKKWYFVDNMGFLAGIRIPQSRDEWA